jgi:mannose-6-phosphate isomerase-like protein (cupin superfamily)
VESGINNPVINHVEQIRHRDSIMAIIVHNQFRKPGIHFFTPDEFSQQLAYMNHPSGKTIAPHFHNEVQRNVTFTQEVLLIKKGRLRVDFYDEKQAFIESRELGAGDVILLASGGHGFEVLEEVEMIEIKQGPYQGDADKTRFNPRHT